MPTTVHKRRIPHTTHGETRVKPGKGKAAATPQKWPPAVVEAKPAVMVDSALLDWDWFLDAENFR